MGKRYAEHMRVVDLVPAERNAKDHADALIDASLGRFGYIESITLDERTGRIISGHGRRDRIIAAQEMGLEPPEGVEVDDEGYWTALVVRGWVSADDAEAEAAGIALNRIGEAGGWRVDVLLDSLDTIASTPIGLEGIGFDTPYLDDLRARLSGPLDLDALAEQHGEPKPEDMWPVIRVKVSPDNRARYARLVAGVTGDDDTVFAHVLDLAETGLEAREHDAA